MAKLKDIFNLTHFDLQDVVAILSAETAEDIESVRKNAAQTLLEHCGNAVYCRGLVEFSNICAMNCLYCGIRSGNSGLRRYSMSLKEILEAAGRCAELGCGSIVLQSGERKDRNFIAFVEKAVREIKRKTVSPALPHGLGITLCVGEQNENVYKRFRDAGAHRYLLRIETSDPQLFARIHPPGQKFESRLKALESLKKIGFQVGTGVMIGLPGQTIEMLAADILFFRDMDIDMIGMGPYIPHNSTPMAKTGRAKWNDKNILKTALLMIAAARIVLKDVNMASTTALQTVHPAGREEGLRFGANVIMPQFTPKRHRPNYSLYNNKPLLEEASQEYLCNLEQRLHALGRSLVLNQWGDSPHFMKKHKNSAYCLK